MKKTLTAVSFSMILTCIKDMVDDNQLFKFQADEQGEYLCFPGRMNSRLISYFRSPHNISL